jgi:hypothetical protein
VLLHDVVNLWIEVLLKLCNLLRLVCEARNCGSFLLLVEEVVFAEIVLFANYLFGSVVSELTDIVRYCEQRLL